MASRCAVLALLVAGLLLQQVNADSPAWFEVGDKNGWTFPPNGIVTYFNDWAGQHTFHVGDTLFFRYKFHSVLEVTQADVASCTTSSPINSYDNAENATVTLDRTGYYGFICGFASHCDGNMRLELTVLASGEIAAPVGSPIGANPSAGNPALAPAVIDSGASSGQFFPAITLGAIFAVCAVLFL